MTFLTNPKFIVAALVLAVCTYFTSEVITNNSGNTASLNGCSCHSNTNSSATTVGITVVGGTSIDTGEEVDIEIKVSHSSLGTFGVYSGVVTTENGSTAAGTVTAGTGTKKSGAGVVHNGKKTGSGNSFTFKYKWKAPTTAGTYYVRAVGNAVNGTGNTAGDVPNTGTTVAITVSATKSVELTTLNNGSVCGGESTDIKWNGSGLGNVKLELSTNGGTSYTSIATGVDGSTGSYSWAVPANLKGTTDNKVKITSESDTDVNDASSSTFTIKGEPSITTQPVAVESCSSEEVLLIVKADAVGASYTWKKDGTAVPNSDNDTLKFNSVKTTDAGDYTVVISTGCGTDATSNSAKLTVNEATSISVQPKGKSVCVGEDLVIDSEVSGTDLTIKWFKDGTEVTGQTAQKLSIPDFDEDMVGDYVMKITSGKCSGEVTSQTAKISAAAKPEITEHPASVISCEGETVEFAVLATGSGIFYQWSKDGKELANENDSNLVIADITSADEGEYTVTVNGLCDPSADSDIATLTIGTKPVISPQPSDLTISVGEPLILTVADNGVADSYEWFKDGNSINTEAGDTLNLGGAELTDSGEYHVVVSNDCESVESDKFTVTVEEASNPVISVSKSELNYDIVEIGQNSSLTVEVSNSGVGTLEIMNVTITGAGAADFSYGGATSFSVSGDMFEELSVTFEPKSAGYSYAELSIESKNGQTKIVPLTGGGRIGQSAFSISSSTGDTIAFTSGDSPTKSISLTNNGPETLTPLTIQFADSDGVSSDLALNTPIAAGTATDFEIEYTHDGSASERTVNYTITFAETQDNLNGTVLFQLSSSVEDAQQYGAKVYPVPSQGEFTLDLGELTNSAVTAKLIDQNGQTVHQQIINSASLTISSTKVSAGSYLLLIELDNNQTRYLRVVFE